MHREPLSLEKVSQKAPVYTFLLPSPQAPWERRHLAGIRGYRPVGEQGGNPGSAPQQHLLPGRRRSRPRAFATPSYGEGSSWFAFSDSL